MNRTTYCVDLTENYRKKTWCCIHLRMFELVIETVQKVNIWLYGDLFKTENHSWHLFFSWQSARLRKQKKKWRQASLLVNLLLSFLKIKTWEFFSRIAQFFNLQIGFTWKFHLSRHSRFRRPSLFPHSLPADFSPSLTNLVNTIYKGKTAQNFIL